MLWTTPKSSIKEFSGHQTTQGTGKSYEGYNEGSNSPSLILSQWQDATGHTCIPLYNVWIQTMAASNPNFLLKHFLGSIRGWPLGSLSLTVEVYIESLAPGFGLAQPWLLWVSDGRSIILYLCFRLPMRK